MDPAKTIRKAGAPEKAAGVVAREHREALEGSDRLALLESLAARRRKELQREAFALGHRLYAERPRRFARRLQACFEAP